MDSDDDFAGKRRRIRFSNGDATAYEEGGGDSSDDIFAGCHAVDSSEDEGSSDGIMSLRSKRNPRRGGLSWRTDESKAKRGVGQTPYGISLLPLGLQEGNEMQWDAVVILARELRALRAKEGEKKIEELRREASEVLGSDAMGSSHPFATVRWLAATQHGKNTLLKHLSAGRLQAERISNPSHRATPEAAIASALQLLGRYQEAIVHWDRAVDTNPPPSERDIPIERPDIPTERALKPPPAWILRAEQCRRQSSAALQATSSSRNPNPNSRPRGVVRVSAKELSWERFQYEFAGKGEPVVITGLLENCVQHKRLWNMAFIRKNLSNKSVITKRAVKGSPAWARLEDAKRTTFGELVDAINTAKDSKLEKPSSINRGEVDLAECYCHDWSIPLHAPHLMENFRIPKYFAGDYLQHMPQGSKYADTWPSLFVGGTGTYSEVHVDAFRSNFWMGLMEGRKRWVFFDEKDMPLLGPQWISPSLDPTFKFTPRDAKQWEYIKANCRPREVELKAGEVLFVPSGCAHYVENLAPTVAISCNYIDESNRCKAAKELEILGASDPRSLFLAKTLTDKAWVEEADSAISSVIRWCEGGEIKNEVTQTDVKSDQHTPFGCSGVGRDGVTVPWVAFKRREGTLRKRRRDSVGTRNVRFADHDKDEVSQSSKRSKLETNDNTIPPGAETLEAFLKRCKNAKTVNDTDGKGVPRFAAMEEEEEIPRVTENVKDNDSEQEKNLVELALGSQIIRIGRRKRRLLKKPSSSNNPQMRCTFISEGRYNYGYRNPWYADHLGDDVDDADTYEDVVGLGYPKALRALGYPKWRNSSSQ